MSDDHLKRIRNILSDRENEAAKKTEQEKKEESEIEEKKLIALRTVEPLVEIMRSTLDTLNKNALDHSNSAPPHREEFEKQTDRWKRKKLSSGEVSRFIPIELGRFTTFSDQIRSRESYPEGQNGVYTLFRHEVVVFAYLIGVGDWFSKTRVVVEPSEPRSKAIIDIEWRSSDNLFYTKPYRRKVYGGCDRSSAWEAEEDGHSFETVNDTVDVLLAHLAPYSIAT